MSEMDPKVVSALLERGCKSYEDAPYCELAMLLSVVRASNHLHLAHHWQTRGPTFYGDHLMYERIYKATTKDVDAIAERAVGLGDHRLVDPLISSQQIADLVKVMMTGAKESNVDQYVLRSMRAITMVVGMVKEVSESLKKKGTLTGGTDNLLQQVADNQEGHLYLLRQRAR